VRGGPVTVVLGAAPLVIARLEVSFEDGLDCLRSGGAVGGVRAPDHVLARLLHRLPVGEDGDAVRVGEVVGRADRLGRVGLVTDVMALHPGAGLALEAPIAEVKSLLDRAPVRFASRLKLAARLAAVERRVSNPSCHRRAPFPRVQRLSNIQAKTPVDKHSQVCTVL